MPSKGPATFFSGGGGGGGGTAEITFVVGEAVDHFVYVHTLGCVWSLLPL